jgi:hypothetical protein
VELRNELTICFTQGMGHGHYPTLLQSLVANERKKNTLTFCVTRSGGYIKLGANPPTGPTTFITPMMGNKKYYIIKILDMQVGSTNLQVNPSVFNSGQVCSIRCNLDSQSQFLAPRPLSALIDRRGC